MNRALLQQALDALECLYSGTDDRQWDGKAIELFVSAIDALRAELAKDEPEPVAWRFVDDEDNNHPTYQSKPHHRHANMIRRWLDDDSLEVEYRCPGDYDWRDISGGTPTWHPNMEYRFKPKMIKCGDMEFPAPVGFDPDKSYYSVLVTVENSTTIAGFHETKFAAEAHARALISLTEVK